MPWPLHLVDYAADRDWEPGDCCYVPREAVTQNPTNGRWYAWGQSLSDTYVAELMALRPPIAVCLPDGFVFVVDSAPTSGDTSGWRVTGEPPDLTVEPSINVIGFYHGWIRGGVLSDDSEGRTYARGEYGWRPVRT